MLFKKLLIATALLGAFTPAMAEQAEMATPQRLIDGSWLNADEIRDSLSQGLSAARTMQKDANVKQMGQEMARRADGIADEAIGAERDKVLRYLGIGPNDKTQLYVFVSTSMPLNLVRQYTAEAAWSGAILVVRGIPDGQTMADFVQNNLKGLVQGKAGATIQLDPRAFELFGVTTVPSIVYTKRPPDELCMGGDFEPVDIPEIEETASVRAELTGPVGFHKCKNVAPEEYWKVDGKVSVHWALNQFKDAGAPVQSRLDAIEKSPYRTVEKAQTTFDGEWSMMEIPGHEKSTIKDARDISSGPAAQ